MKSKVSNIVADFLLENQISHVFSVVGGGAMHLNDSLGHREGLSVIYHHHEQAASMAAEAYARIENKIACVCVTSGPGSTNAITGCLCAFTDSIPLLIISGNTSRITSIKNTGLNLRIMGIQEVDIIRVVKPITKYSETIDNPYEILYQLEKALYIAKNERPGPVWLDIPLDVQASYVETDELTHFYPAVKKIDKEELVKIFDQILSKINSSSRPVLIGGQGIRLAGAHNSFMNLIEFLQIPIVTGQSSVDLIETDHSLFVGRSGITGDRPGNFAVQNSDLVISIGNRLGINQIGFNHKTWARGAFKIMVDIDNNELKKPTLNIDLPVCIDAKIFIDEFTKYSKNFEIKPKIDWINRCQKWKKKYPVVLKKHLDNREKINIYAFFNYLSEKLLDNEIILVSVGTARIVGSQTSKIKKGQRFITNVTTAAMGYCLPAAIGLSYASQKSIINCVTGDGSIQMNLQELQVIKHHNLPIRIFVLNNGGYHSIRQTQMNYFSDQFIGIGEDSEDLSFPDLSKVAIAYNIPYYKCEEQNTFAEDLSKILKFSGPLICEIIISKDQFTEPKLASRILDDGRMVSSVLEDMYPFLSREELQENMYIPLIEN
jgi:acetolactate synthase-1/2/3 large subunit